MKSDDSATREADDVKASREPYVAPTLTKHGDAQDISPEASLPWLDVSVEELVAALNDERLAEDLMQKRGWNKNDLLARAELITKKLAAQTYAVV